MERVGIDPKIVPLVKGVEDNLTTIEAVLKASVATLPNARLFIIDGFATLVPGGKTNDYHAVANFLRNITRLCKKHDITILGLIHAAKTKENEKYLNPRERILGSVAWAGFSETLFFIAPIAPDDVENKYRLLEILPRQAAQERFELQLDDSGCLITSTRRIELDAECIAFLDKVPPDGEFSADEIAAALSLGRTKAHRLLNTLLENGAIKKVKRGLYARVTSAFFGAN